MSIKKTSILINTFTTTNISLFPGNIIEIE